jgi:hypothetical protein
MRVPGSGACQGQGEHQRGVDDSIVGRAKV